MKHPRLRAAWTAAVRAKDSAADAMSFHRADSLHIAKTTLAAVLAWAGARWLTMADAAVWMGPATAVIVVQATVYRSLANGVRRVGAVTAGVMLAGLVGRLVGLNAISLVLIVTSAMLAARWRRIGDRASDIVTTAVLMLSYGASTADQQYLRDYVIQTAMGALAGVVVNLFIPPPLQVRRSYALMQDLTRSTARLLRRIGDGLRDGYDDSSVNAWQKETDGLDARLSDVAKAVRSGAESRRFNARRLNSPVPPPQAYLPLLHAMRLIMPSVSSIVRALDHPAEADKAAESVVSPAFARAYAELLRLTAEALDAQGRRPAGVDPDVRRQVGESLDEATRIQERVTELVDAGKLSRPRNWAVSGTLLVDAERILATLRRCADALDETAAARGRTT